MKKKRKVIQLTEAQFDRVINETLKKSVRKQTLMSSAVLMDWFGFKDDDLCKFYEQNNRYWSAVEEHLISVNLISKLLSEHTGVDIKWD